MDSWTYNYNKLVETDKVRRGNVLINRFYNRGTKFIWRDIY